MEEVTQAAPKPTHYCVSCAARWIKHDDGTWSVQTPCGPCCDNTPMDEAPLIEFQPDGTIDGRDYDKAKEKLARAERERHVAAYRGIKCARCDEPFERQERDWSCPKRVPPRFKFPPESEAATTIEKLRSALEFIADLPDPGEESERSATFYRVHAALLKQIAAGALGRQIVSDEAMRWAEEWWNSEAAVSARQAREKQEPTP